MCKELQDELDRGDALAKGLVEHVQRMGANQAEMPVDLGVGGKWQVVVKSGQAMGRESALYDLVRVAVQALKFDANNVTQVAELAHRARQALTKAGIPEVIPEREDIPEVLEEKELPADEDVLQESFCGAVFKVERLCSKPLEEGRTEFLWGLVPWAALRQGDVFRLRDRNGELVGWKGGIIWEALEDVRFEQDQGCVKARRYK